MKYSTCKGRRAGKYELVLAANYFDVHNGEDGMQQCLCHSKIQAYYLVASFIGYTFATKAEVVQPYSDLLT
jgi:hypothetical protein